MDFWSSIPGRCAWEEGEAETTWGLQLPPEKLRAEALAPFTRKPPTLERYKGP